MQTLPQCLADPEAGPQVDPDCTLLLDNITGQAFLLGEGSCYILQLVWATDCALSLGWITGWVSLSGGATGYAP